MKGDLISRKELVKALIAERDKHPPETIDRYSFGVKLPNRFNQAIRGGIRKALREVEMAPTVDTVPVVHARWDDDCVCSACEYQNKISMKSFDGSETISVYMPTRFCPSCGAKMNLTE